MSEFTFDNAIETLDRFLTYKEEKMIDLSEYRYVEPLGFAILKSIVLENPRINVCMHRDSPAYKYAITLLHGTYDPDKTYLPLENVKNGREIDKTTNKMVNKILKIKKFENLNYMDKLDLSRYLKYMIGEILNNAIYHSGSPIGAVVSAQYFPSQEKLQVVVVDKGVGFLRNLKKRYKVTTETQALVKALKKGVTSPPAMSNPYYSSTSHAGYGLYILSCILEHTRGKLLMISNNGAIFFDEGKIRKSKDNISVQWKGSIVAFEFQDKNINFSIDDFFKMYVHIEEKDESEIEDIFVEG